MRDGLYARGSTHNQHTLPLHSEAMKEYAANRRTLVVQAEEVASGTSHRPERDRLLKAARRRGIDALLVRRLDRWGRSLPDLFGNFQEHTSLGVGFVSPMAAMPMVFAEFEREVLRERVKAGIHSTRANGKTHGRPRTAQRKSAQVLALHEKGGSHRLPNPARHSAENP